MNDTERGKIRNRVFAQQIRDFSGLRFGKITPTDIDAFLDFGNKTFIFIESKHGNSELPYGQRLALERLCDACHSGDRRSILLQAKHETESDIDFANIEVVKYYYQKKWNKPKTKTTVKEAIEKMIFPDIS